MDSYRLRESLYERLTRARDADAPALAVLRARRFLGHFPDFGPVWAMLGIDLTTLGRYEEAEQAFREALEHWPDANRRIPHLYQGHLLAAAGEPDRAAESYRRAIDEAPDHASAYISLGDVYFGQGRLAEAEESYRGATRCREGRLDEAFLDLGYVLRALQRFEDAAACFEEAIRRDPGDRNARRALRDVEACQKEWRRTRPGDSG
jgi:tetratricopeptide (TPR) repeat protein